MTDDIVLSKISTIQRCLVRISEEFYAGCKWLFVCGHNQQYEVDDGLAQYCHTWLTATQPRYSYCRY